MKPSKMLELVENLKVGEKVFIEKFEDHLFIDKKSLTTEWMPAQSDNINKYGIDLSILNEEDWFYVEIEFESKDNWIAKGNIIDINNADCIHYDCERNFVHKSGYLCDKDKITLLRKATPEDLAPFFEKHPEYEPVNKNITVGAMSSSILKTINFQNMTKDNKQQKLSDSTNTAIAYSTCYRQYCINVLSLFDGISCGQIALERAGYEVRQYFASEIKPHAIRCTQHNFPNTIQIGDITKVKGEDLPKIDLLIGGSPCKGISRLNKNQEGLEHAESKLFWEYVRLLEEVKPKYFLLENTHGNKEATKIITETLGVKPISINSRLVSAQNRPRYYWTNIPEIKQPNDKGITTKDVFEFDGQIADKCRIDWLQSESGKKSINKGYTRVNPYPKSGCLTANGHRKWNENYLLKDGVYRYLSQNELEKLQTLPIGYTSVLNYDEAYDCIGDGWTVDIIAHILKYAVW